MLKADVEEAERGGRRTMKKDTETGCRRTSKYAAERKMTKKGGRKRMKGAPRVLGGGVLLERF